MIEIVDRLATREITNEKDILEALSEYPELECCDFLDYPGDVDDILICVKVEIRNDWERIQNLKVIYGKWSKILMAVLYFKENSECEIQFLKKNFDLDNEQEVYTKLEEEKDEPKILDFDNIKWGVLTGVLLSIIVGFLILKPLDTSRDTWMVLCVILFCGFCFILGTVSEELGEYSELKKPHTTLYRSIGNFVSLMVVLFSLQYVMWSFVAGKIRIIDGGKGEVVYKKDVFDYERRELVKGVGRR